MMSERLPQIFLIETEFPLMQFAEASLAKTYRLPEGEPGLTDSELDYGGKSSGSQGRPTLDTSSLKTSQKFVLADWNYCSLHSMRSGTMRSGTVSPLPMLARLTVVTDSGSSLTGRSTHSVPTPTSSDHIRRKCTSTEAMNLETNKSVSLDRWLGGVPNPQWSEWLMGFPVDWTLPD